MENTVPVRSVKKALDLLDQIIVEDIAGGAASLSELARRMKMPTNSAHNLLKTLTSCGYVAQASRGIYTPGTKLRQLNKINHFKSPAWQQVVISCMQPFVKTHQEACILAMLVEGQRVVISQMDSNQSIQVARESVQQAPFYQLPTGRMLAAMATEQELEQIINNHGLPGKQWNDITSKKALRSELTSLLRQRWCQAQTPDQELISWACPVYDTHCQAWAVVGTYAPLFRCPKARQTQLLKALQKLATRISRDTQPPLLTIAGRCKE